MYGSVRAPTLMISNLVDWVPIELSIVLIRPMSGVQKVPNGGTTSTGFLTQIRSRWGVKTQSSF